MNTSIGDKKKSVLFVLPTVGTGGSERVVFNLSRNLKPQFSPVIASFRDGALHGEMTKAGIPVYVLDRKSGIDLTLISKLQQIIRTHNVRIVNSHHFVSLFYAFWAARRLCVPLMHTEHSQWEMETLSPFWNFCFKMLLKRVQMVNAVSDATFAYLKDTYCVTDTKLRLTLNGIDFESFHNDGSRTNKRQLMGVDDQDLVVGIVGNLRNEKNQGLLIRAMSLLKHSGRVFKAVLVGDGPCRMELAKLAYELGVEQQVIFLGTRNDVPQLYGAFDAYCLTSHFEGLPLTILEAMSAGLPVIGTDVLGIRELITHNENGLLVQDNDAEQLADAIKLLERDNLLKDKLSQNGRCLVHDKFSLEQSVQSYKNIFMTLI